MPVKFPNGDIIPDDDFYELQILCRYLYDGLISQREFEREVTYLGYSPGKALEYCRYIREGLYERVIKEVAYFRCQVMLEFIGERKKPSTPDPFFESRTWHFIKREIERKPEEHINYDTLASEVCEELESELLDEAWYQLIIVPSVIDALRKEAIVKPYSYHDYKEESEFIRAKALIGVESEKVDEDEVEGYEICKTYRYMINYKSNYEWDNDRIESELSMLERCIKQHTLTDFTGQPMTKQHIIRLMKQGYWERIFRTLYRCWKELGMWWGD